MQITVGTYEGTLLFFNCDINQIKPIKSLQISQNSIKSVCCIDGKYLVAGGHDQEVRVIDLQTHQEKVQAKENVGQITKIVRITDTLFAVGVDDGTIRLWNAQNWNIVTHARFHKKSVNSMNVCKQGKLMISAGGNKIILWSAQNLKKAHQYKFNNESVIENIKMSQDMKSIYFSNSASELYKMSTQDNQQKLLLKMPVPRKIQDFVLFDKFIIIVNDIGEVLTWQLEDNDTAFNYEKRIWFQAHQARIKEVKIVDNTYLIVVTAAGDISLWDFPQFLLSVDNISQNYQLEGLKPLCSTKIKGRILCVDAIVQRQQKQPQRKKSSFVEQRHKSENVQQQNNDQQVLKKKIKKNKTKLIQKQQKHENKQDKAPNSNKKMKKHKNKPQ